MLVDFRGKGATVLELNPTKDLIAIKYLEALAKMAEGKATKMFIPYEASAIMSAVAVIAEALKDKTETEKK